MKEQVLEQVPLKYLFDKHPVHHKILLKQKETWRIKEKALYHFWVQLRNITLHLSNLKEK